MVIIFTTTDPKVTEPEENIVRLGSIPFFAFKDRRVAIQGLGKSLPNYERKMKWISFILRLSLVLGC